ncbi:FAD-dependent monooxygenase [Foetidibacter luteolus]|uniref:FAD-dependent monooxygenase n=1 Tax=Foetidibacter luteolus TaxID=2608880 RepID=UPI00129AF115|nr:FAD-dependent monooxygenase [Foetidibacter luteolus]
MQIAIAGAGIAGLTTAIALKNKGIETQIFEAAPAVKGIGAGLALAANAMQAFERLGIAEEVSRCGRMLPSFTIYDEKKKVINRTNSEAISKKYGADNFTIHRAALYDLLYSKLNPQQVVINKKLVAAEQLPNGIKLVFQDGSIHFTDALIAADGIHSSIRKKLLPASAPRYAGYTCWRAVINNDFLNLTETSETWGLKGRFGIVPLLDKVYWFACINAPYSSSRMKAFTIDDLQRHFKDFHEPIPAILQQTKNEHLIWNDIMDIRPIHQYAFGNILLIGDAAHATTPNLGQGACQAIEDAVILANELAANANIPEAFKQFEQRRLKRTHYITNTSWKIGKAAQTSNRLFAGIRNTLFRLLPQSVNEKQFQKLYRVDF